MHRSVRCSRLFAAFNAAAVLCIALPALAAQITDVRVGVHPKYTRIVFELDGRAGYQVERVGTDSAPELRITIEAMSSARELRANGDVRGVKVDAGTKARAHIALRQPGLRVHEMMLSDPPRIVIDLHKPETAVAATAKPAPKPKAAEKTPAPTPEPKVAAKEAPAPPAPAPKVVAKETPKPEPAPKVVAKETPKPEPAPKVVAPTPPPAPEAPKAAVAPPTPEPAPKVVAPIPPVPPAQDSALKPVPRVTPPPSETAQAAKPAAPPAPEAPKTAAVPPAPLPAPGPTTPPAAVPPAPVAPTPDSVAKLPPALAPPTPHAAPPPSPVRPTPTPAPTSPAPPPTADESWSARLTSNPIRIGIIAAALLSLGAIVLVQRRRRALPNDLDVTAIAEEVEQTSDAPGRIPSGGFAMGDDSASPPREDTLAGLFDRPAAPAPVWPAPPPSAKPAPRPTPAAAAAEDSLFEDAGEMAGEPDAREGDAPMNQEMDLPVDRRTSPPAARMGGSAAPSPDIARMLQDFERRIATLEARLDESNEAREKLERQVAAQSEELRVQRAAIARTQRALRTMTRGEEDKATEPALRDGDTQAKTRVTP